MEEFRIIYLRNSALTAAETYMARDMLDAIDKASKRCRDASAEIWTTRGRVAVINPLPSQSTLSRPVSVNTGEKTTETEAEITALMKARLNLASD